jgi:hypothetical protein
MEKSKITKEMDSEHRHGLIRLYMLDIGSIINRMDMASLLIPVGITMKEIGLIPKPKV